MLLSSFFVVVVGINIYFCFRMREVYFNNNKKQMGEVSKLLNFYLSELKWIFQNHMGKIISYDKVKYDTFLTTEGIFSHFAKAEDGCPG